MKEENDVIVDVKRKKQEKIAGFLGILFILWFFGSIVAMMYFSEIGEENYTIMVCGQYFLVFSFFPLNGGKGKDKLVGVPFLLAGICMVGIPLCIMNPQWFEEDINWVFVVPLLLILAFVLAGLALVIFPWKEKRRLEKVCTEIVDATIIKHLVRYSDKGNRLYCSVYKFNYYNEEYEVPDNFYTNIGVKPVDTQVELKINPDNPKEFISGKMNNFSIIQFMGIIFLIVSVPIFIGMITGSF